MIEADIILFSDILGRDIDANDILFSNAVVDIAAMVDLDYDFKDREIKNAVKKLLELI